MLVNYQKSGEAFKNVNKIIAKYLSTIMINLKIKKSQGKAGENVKCNLG